MSYTTIRNGSHPPSRVWCDSDSWGHLEFALDRRDGHQLIYRAVGDGNNVVIRVDADELESTGAAWSQWLRAYVRDTRP